VNGMNTLLELPVDLGIWLLLGYTVVVVAGSKLSETLARAHFERARRYAEQGFRYNAEQDHYDCPRGELLTLHRIEPEQKLAVYRAPASSCAGCSRKAACTPHDEGRHIYRSLTAWTETEVGQFHQRLSLLMIAGTAVVSLAGFINWFGRPGSGLLLVAFLTLIPILIREVRWALTVSTTPQAGVEDHPGEPSR